MQPFYWNRNFEIGIPSVDQQHYQLVALINSLGEAMGASRPLPEIHEVTEALMAYAVEHFTDEERLLAEAPLPETEKEQHRAAHRSFVEKAQALALRTDLQQADVAQNALDFLTTWLVGHILGTDRKIAVALKLIPSPSGAEPLLDVSPVERILLGALTETERRFRLLSDDTPSLIWVSDMVGKRGFFNRAWAELLGQEPETISNGWQNFIHPVDLPAYSTLLASLIENPRVANAEFRLRNWDGHDRWFFERILPRRAPDGGFLGLIASATDVTSLKEAELLLSHANEDLEKEVAR
ncbi:MAG: bacteriohemerythrin, partial [Holophaga sp.]|nr:bacteriohemerythrin [Holophaga sp.]